MLKASSIRESDTEAGASVGAQSSLPTTEVSSPNRSYNGSIKESHDSVLTRARSHFSEEITLVHADIPIIACALVSGICDSSAYNAWTCFVSMQTGNTIFLALGASGQPISHPYGWVKSLMSIFFFLCGCLFFAQTRHFGAGKSRGILSLSFLLQGICVIIAAALVQGKVVPEPFGVNGIADEVDFIDLIPLAFLAFQSGGQIVTSRILGFNEVPTTVLTSVYCDIASDPKIFAWDNVKRNRRVGAVLAILSGGIAGGWISRSSAGLSAALWLAAAIKLTISFSWAVWKSKPVALINALSAGANWHKFLDHKTQFSSTVGRVELSGRLWDHGSSH
ncbi:hypothetical protein SBOR_8600 [Sclerotinia borealis F-4128]|uniref:DUF1275 domain protein n=1 Tax=Sclerotinia borealis (strain F-4128) TaxID=1432307 RepID=W9C834_SCLBF|nr:hypothetical protein SBOR_8600 [Sclerotinia borealis F-4128]